MSKALKDDSLQPDEYYALDPNTNEEKKMRISSEIASDPASLSLSSDRDVPLSERVNSGEFDFLFWRYLEPMYFRPNEDGDPRLRLGLFTQKEIETMEEEKERILVYWDHDSAAAQLAKAMVIGACEPGG
ncbi:hypothetical protein F4859DRAFT_519370 [Xylaria cf. heliscus]|nr:hypothetical protein F4859DRAFT_519370 [Xylaria cf. heliscus]